MKERRQNVLQPLVLPVRVRKPGATGEQRMLCKRLLVPEWMVTRKEIDHHILKRELLAASGDLFEGRELPQSQLVVSSIEEATGTVVLDQTDTSPQETAPVSAASTENRPRALSRHKPDLILTGHGFRLTPATRHALRYLMQTDGTQEQEDERDRLIPQVLASVSQSVRDANHRLVTFAEVVRIFTEECRAAPRSTEIRLNVFQMDKPDLLHAVRANGLAIDVLTGPPIFPILKPLAEKAKFVARYLIISLAEKPSYRRLLALASRQSKSEEELTGELGIELNLIRGLAQREWRKNNLVSTFFAQEEALRKMSAVYFARVAMLFLKEQGDHYRAGKGLNTFTSVLRHAYRENSNLSLAVLNAAFSLNSWFMEELFGQPQTTCAIILGGANARREFPSYDYDVIGIYRDQGETAGGCCGSISHVIYFNFLMDLIKMTLQSMDKNFDTKFQNICGLKSEVIDSDEADLDNISVGTLEEYERHFRRNAERLHEDRISMMTLAHGAGDSDLTKAFQTMVDKVVLQPTVDNPRGVADEVMRWYVKKNYSKSENNIKHSRGGLRDIHRVVWLSGKRDNPTDIPYALKEVFRGNPDAYERIMLSYNFLMNLRIRIDLYYGRNDKYLPKGEERERFARSLGYSCGQELADECQRYMKAAAEVADAYFQEVLSKDETLREIVDLEIARQEHRLERQKREQEREAEKEHKKAVGTAASMIGGRSSDVFLRQLWAERFVNHR
jgi:hypothetical protein